MKKTRRIRSEKPVVMLSLVEVHRILQTVLRDEYREMLPFYVLSLFAGIRSTEAEKLNWEDVRLERKKPFVNVS